MNRLNKIILSFVLSFFCLLISVSCAIIEKDTTYTVGFGSSYGSFYETLGTYSNTDVSTALKNYVAGTDTQTLVTIMNDLKTQNVINGKWMVIDYPAQKYSYLTAFSATSSFSNCDFVCDTGKSFPFYFLRSDVTQPFSVITIHSAGGKFRDYNVTSTSSVQVFAFDQARTLVSASSSVYSGSISDNKWSWDGTYIYEVSQPDEPDITPSLPSNAEIAQAVQAFYDSDYYKNNTDFKDFLVMYNYNTQYFSFIGHNYEDKFQQLIFPAGYKYNQQWWKFGLDGLTTELSSYIFDKYYWLYSTNDFGENFIYNGKGLLSDLLELNFSTSSTIVYSTNEYDVVVYSYNENNELTSEMDTMPGDQYTYDENLDPTTNEYNPLENFIPTNPNQSILGDVDFNEINKVFEENKDILNIENASWLFSANNQLVSYFLGFLLLLIVFLIISRVLGG